MARGDPGEGGYTPQVSPEDLPRKIVPRASGITAAPEFSGAVDSIAKKYNADSATWAGDQLTQARKQAISALDTAKQNLPAGQDPGNFAGDYLANFDKTTAPVMDQASRNPVASQMLQKGLSDLRDTLADHTVKYEAQQRVAYRTDSFQTNLSTQLPLIQAHPELAPQIGSSLADQARSIGTDSEHLYPMLKQMHQQISAATADGVTNQNPQMMYDALKSPEKASDDVKTMLSGLSDSQREGLLAKATKGVSDNYSNGVIDTYRNNGPVAGAKALQAVNKLDQPADIKEQMRSDIEKGVNQWHQEARQTNAQPIMGLEERLASGKPNPDDRALSFSLWHKGALTTDQAGEYAGRIDKAQEKQAEAEAWYHAIDGAYKAGQPLDPKDKDIRSGVDDVFTRYTKGVNPGTPEWVNRGADIAAKTGVTPDSVISWARTSLVSGDTASAARAADTIQRQQDANPRGIGYAMDPETKSQAKMINDAIHAGTNPDAAVLNARKITSMPDADKLRLEELYKKQKIGDQTTGALNNELNGDPKFARGGIWPFKASAPDIPPAMTGQFEQLRQNYFKLTNGDVKQTNDLAFADMKNTWGVTNVNGKSEYMEFAPEAMNPGLKTDFLRKDMETSAKGLTPDPSKVRLIPTPETYHSEGQRWALGVPDKFGAYSALTDKRGLPLPYQLPTATASVHEAQAKAATEGMARLHEAQKQQKLVDKFGTEALEQTSGELQ